MKYFGYEFDSPNKKMINDPFFFKNNMGFTESFGTIKESDFWSRNNRNIDLSVIIPNYNNGDLLEKSVNSLGVLLNNEDVEILVIDDCSTDNSESVIHGLQKKIHNLYWTSFNTNSGVPTIRNFGIYSSYGQYIMFLDADDFLFNTKEILGMLEFSKQNNLDLINSNPRIWYSNDDNTQTLYFDDQYENARVTDVNEISRMNFQALWLHGRIFKSLLIKNNYIHFPNITFFEDDKFLQDVYLNSNKIGFWDKSIYIYNRKESNKSITSNINDTKSGKMRLISTRVAIMDYNTRNESEFFLSEIGKKIIARKIELNFFYKFLENKNLNQMIKKSEELTLLRFRIIQILKRVENKDVFKHFIKQDRVFEAKKLIEKI